MKGRAKMHTKKKVRKMPFVYSEPSSVCKKKSKLQTKKGKVQNGVWAHRDWACERGR